MPAPYSAGSIFVSVIPSFKDNQRDIAREYQRRGEEASESFSGGFDKQIAKDLPKAMEKAVRGSKQAQVKAGDEAGDNYSNAFRKSLIDGLKSAQKDLDRLQGPDTTIQVPIGVDKDKFLRDFGSLVRNVNLTRADLEVGADVGQAIYDVDRLINKLREIRDASTNPEIRTNLTAGLGSLETATARARKAAALEPEPTAAPQAPRPEPGAFNRGLAGRLGSALQALPPIPVDADVTPARAKIIEFREDAFRLLDDIEADVDLDSDDTLARARGLMVLLEGVIETADPTAEIDASFNAAGALAQIKTWAQAVDPVEVPIEPEMGFFRQRVAQQLKAAGEALPEIPILADASDAEHELSNLRMRMLLLGEKVKIGLDLDEARQESLDLQRILGQLRRDNVDIEVDVNAARAIIELEAIERAANDADKALNRSARGADDGANSFRAFSARVLAVATVGPLAIPIIGALGAGLGVLAPLAVAGAAGLGVFALGVMGVSDAVSAMGEVQTNAADDLEAYQEGVSNAAKSVAAAERTLADARRSAAESAQRNARSITDAQGRVTDAERDAAESAQRSARSIRDAQKGVTDAREQAARAATQSARRVAQAAEAVADAEDDLADAQRDAERQQEGITQAREDYAERMLDLQMQVRGGALAERRAYMQLAEAEIAYASALADPGATRTEREQLLLDLDEQKFRLESVQLANRRVGEEASEAARKGVEGSDEVVSATERAQQANERVADAQAAVASAVAASQQAQLDAQQQAADSAARIADAELRLADARVDADQRALEATQAIADANARVADARDEADRRAAQSAQAITDAQLALAEAQADYSDAIAATSTSQDKLAESMAKLSPAGREFAEYLFSLKPFLDDLRATAQEGLLPGIQEWMQGVITTHGPQFIAIVGGMATALGDMFRGFGEALQGPEWSAFFDMLESKGPVFLGQIGEVLTNLGTGIASLIVAFAPAAEDFGNSLVRASESFANWAAGLRDTQGFQTFMEWWERVGPKVMDFFWALGAAVGNLAVALAPYAEDLMDVVTAALDFIAAVDPDVLGAIAVSVLGVATAFQTLVGLNALISGFGTIIGLASAALAVFNGTAVGTSAILLGWAGIAAIAIAAMALIGVAFYLLWTQSETFRNIVTGAWNAVMAAVDYVVNWFQTHAMPVIETVLQAIGSFFTWLWEEIIGPILGLLQMAWETLWNAMVTIWNDFGRPMIELVWSVIQDLWEIVGPIFQLIGIAFKALWDFAVTWWNAVGKPLFEAIIDIMTWLWKNVMDPAINWIAEAFGWLFGVMKSTWETIGKPVLDFFQAVVEGLVDVFQGTFDGIEDIWNALLDILMAPIVFVVETVLNEGLIAGVNHIAGIFTNDDTWIDPIPTDWIPGRAMGGPIPGSSPHKRADNVLIRATAGEYMHDVDATQYYGLDIMNAMNQRLIPREALLAGLQGRAYGGLVSLGRRLEGMGATVSRHSAFDGRTPTSGHGRTSLHYTDNAIDVNTRPGTSALEQRELDPMAALARSLGFRTIWRTKDHFNHLHIDNGKGASLGQQGGGGIGGLLGDLGNMLGGAFDAVTGFLGDPLGVLKKMVSDAAGDKLDSPIGRLLLDIPMGLAGLAKDKLVGLVSSVGDFFTGANGGDNGAVDAVKATDGGVQNVVKAVAARYGWDRGEQWTSLSRLIQKESGWNPKAQNPTSTAYGLFQFLNGTWRGTGVTKTADPAGQAQAGMKYIADRYGDPIRALQFHNRNNWYADGGLIKGPGLTPYLHDEGGVIDPGWNLIYNATRKPEASLNPTQLDNIQRIADGGGARSVIDQVHIHEVATDVEEAVGEIAHWAKVYDAGGRYTP